MSEKSEVASGCLVILTALGLAFLFAVYMIVKVASWAWN